jgi:hypothetical protein
MSSTAYYFSKKPLITQHFITLTIIPEMEISPFPEDSCDAPLPGRNASGSHSLVTGA